MEWPRCPARFAAVGFDLSCELPKNHEMDGSPYHRDPLEGLEWSLTVGETGGCEEGLGP